jgi:hypothetical protein
VTSYNVYFGTVSGLYTANSTTCGNSPCNTGSVATSFNLTGLTSSTLYFIVISALNVAIEGPQSAEVSGTAL